MEVRAVMVLCLPARQLDDLAMYNSCTTVGQQEP